jgi:two-component system, NtrC family, response regulator HydG
MNTPRVLIAEDDPEMRALLAEEFDREGFEAVPARSGPEAVQLLADRQVDVGVTDLRMQEIDGMEILRAAQELRPAVPVIIVTGYGSVPSAVDAIRAGAFEYMCKPIALAELVSAVRRATEGTRSPDGTVPHHGQLPRNCQLGNLVGSCTAMIGVFDLIKRAAATSANVLITGESGTGKELVAQAIHENSGRKRARFVPVNCAGLPEALVESELLGHVRGAFTGATISRRGLIEEAHGGTLFLDEIAELPIVLQAKLLRVLQDKVVRPVGSNRAQVSDFRLVTATNQNPRNQVAAGALRADLFFRLNVIHIGLPPLRERGEDLSLLVHHFIDKHATAVGSQVRGISPEAFYLLEAYSWPGNVRELENAIEHAIAVAETDAIQPRDLPTELREPRRSDMRPAGTARPTLKDLQERLITRVLEETGGDRGNAARILGVHPRTLRRRDQRKENEDPYNAEAESPFAA